MDSLKKLFELLSSQEWDAQKRTAALTCARSLRADVLDSCAGSAFWDGCNVSCRELSLGIRELALGSCKSDQALLASLYFKLLASDNSPVRCRALYRAAWIGKMVQVILF
jgi:hypothetical protein